MHIYNPKRTEINVPTASYVEIVEAACGSVNGYFICTGNAGAQLGDGGTKHTQVMNITTGRLI
jgi:hypothetical protein